jgi:hypothetical protein
LFSKKFNSYLFSEVELLSGKTRTEWSGVSIEELFSNVFREPQFSPNSKWLSFVVNGFLYLRNVDPFSGWCYFILNIPLPF